MRQRETIRRQCPKKTPFWPQCRPTCPRVGWTQGDASELLVSRDGNGNVRKTRQDPLCIEAHALDEKVHSQSLDEGVCGPLRRLRLGPTSLDVLGSDKRLLCADKQLKDGRAALVNLLSHTPVGLKRYEHQKCERGCQLRYGEGYV